MQEIFLQQEETGGRFENSLQEIKNLDGPSRHCKEQAEQVCQGFDCQSLLTVSFFRAITRIYMGIDSVCCGRKINSASNKHVEIRRLWGDLRAHPRT